MPLKRHSEVVVMDNIEILVDSREQQNSHILQYFDSKNIPYRVQALTSGDYSLSVNGVPQNIWVERKSTLNELTKNFTVYRERFKKEFERMPTAQKILLIEDSNYSDIIDHKYGSKMSPKALLGSLLTWQYIYGLRIFFMPKRYSGNFIYYQLHYYLQAMKFYGYRSLKA
jgi:ERCC4-type nuclease